MFSGFLVEFGPPPNLRVSVSFLSSHIERLPQAGCVQQCACKCLTTGSLKGKKNWRRIFFIRGALRSLITSYHLGDSELPCFCLREPRSSSPFSVL